MKIIQFTVPHRTLSINQIYGHRTDGRKFMPEAGRNYMALVALMAKQAMRADGHKLIETPFSMTVVYYMLPKNEMDVTNCEKALIDAMQGIVFKNDKLLGKNGDPYWSERGIYFSATFRKFVGMCQPHIDVTITYY